MPPTPEYCFLWIDWWPLCMAKGEWSGWAQAFGAILALAIAILLPVKARREECRDAHDVLLIYAAQLSTLCAEIVEACEVQSWEAFNGHRHVLFDSNEIAKSVPLAPLRGDAIATYMSLRTFAMALYVQSADHTPGGNWLHWRDQFRLFQEEIATGIRLFRKSR
ncbi:hypothetical protein QTI33_08050 [Variovorax sp. J22P271]|uniref:hypothetical protein n=1 Tax=Variovorax davisae TaxID=3053515 RepID=UPI002574FB0D|nr:hypothetical protein [Variovorax sp. J22P271]MDM0032090.1 hypothetical protein [Variovorax sp. J22P271]